MWTANWVHFPAEKVVRGVILSDKSGHEKVNLSGPEETGGLDSRSYSRDFFVAGELLVKSPDEL